jgi:heme exporter protein D
MGSTIWWSYAVFFAVLVADALAPVMQRRKTLRELHGRLKRRAAGKAT